MVYKSFFNRFISIFIWFKSFYHEISSWNLINKLKFEMYYKCPNCTSMRKPKIIRYFPPKIAKCLDCSYQDKEKVFIIKDTSQKTLISAIN